MRKLFAVVRYCLGVFLAVAAGTAYSATNELVGVWKVIAFQAETKDGRLRNMYGDSPTGLIVYAANGYMSAQAVQADLPKCGTTDRRMCPDREARLAYDGYMGYWGRFEVNESERMIVHVVEGASLPDMIGIRLKRFYTLADSRLVIRTPPQQVKGEEVVVVVTLERVQ
jgi:hypothetical protein